MIVSNSIEAYAYYTKEDKMLSDFYERDRGYSDMEDVMAIVENLKSTVDMPKEMENTEINVETKEEVNDALKDFYYDE